MWCLLFTCLSLVAAQNASMYSFSGKFTQNSPKLTPIEMSIGLCGTAVMPQLYYTTFTVPFTTDGFRTIFGGGFEFLGFVPGNSIALNTTNPCNSTPALFPLARSSLESGMFAFGHYFSAGNYTFVLASSTDIALEFAGEVWDGMMKGATTTAADVWKPVLALSPCDVSTLDFIYSAELLVVPVAGVYSLTLSFGQNTSASAGSQIPASVALTVFAGDYSEMTLSKRGCVDAQSGAIIASTVAQNQLSVQLSLNLTAGENYTLVASALSNDGDPFFSIYSVVVAPPIYVPFSNKNADFIPPATLMCNGTTAGCNPSTTDIPQNSAYTRFTVPKHSWFFLYAGDRNKTGALDPTVDLVFYIYSEDNAGLLACGSSMGVTCLAARSTLGGIAFYSGSYTNFSVIATGASSSLGDNGVLMLNILKGPALPEFSAAPTASPTPASHAPTKSPSKAPTPFPTLAPTTPAPTYLSISSSFNISGSQVDPLDPFGAGPLQVAFEETRGSAKVPAFFIITFSCGVASRFTCTIDGKIDVVAEGVLALDGSPLTKLGGGPSPVLRLANFSESGIVKILNFTPSTTNVTVPFELELQQDLACPDKFWACNQDSLFCCPCPIGASCPDGAWPRALDGYIGLNSTFFLQCNPDDACAAGRCVSPPYENPQGACNTCMEGYYRRDRVCVACPRTAALVLAIGVIFFFVALLLILKFAKTSEVTSFAFQISLGFIQLISIYGTLPFSWPSATRSMFDVLSFTNFNIDLFSPECAISSSYWSKWVLKMMFPVIAVGTFVMLFFVVKHCQPLRKLYIRWLLFSPLDQLMERRRTVSLDNSSIQLGMQGEKPLPSPREQAFLWEEENLSARFVAAMTMCGTVL